MTATTNLMPTMPASVVRRKPSAGTPSMEECATRDPFFYGSRLQRVQNEAGEEQLIEIPIQPQDFLNPQHGDHFVQGNFHDDDVDAGKSIFRRRHIAEAETAVYCDMQMDWGIEGLSKPCPDIAIIPHVRNKQHPRQSFDVQTEGTRPRLVIEFVSPRYVDNDYEDKVGIYERAGVEEYIIIDSGLRQGITQINYSVSGYRLQDRHYVEIVPDASGQIYSQVSNVWIVPSSDAQSFEVFDGTTGELLLPDEEEIERERNARIQAIDRAEVAEEIAEQERLARSQAEEIAEQERQAKEVAQREVEHFKAYLRTLGIDPDKI